MTIYVIQIIKNTTRWSTKQLSVCNYLNTVLTETHLGMKYGLLF